jgi:valacyclovir hydrolase
MHRKVQAIGDGVHLSYLDEGQGQPLLFIHGFTGTALADFDDLIAELRPTHRVIAPDLRGYGASRPPNRDFPTHFYQRDAADLAALLDGIGCGPVVVLGFSDGAEASLLLASARPDLVRGVVAWGVCGVIAPEEVEAVQSWLPVSAWGESRQTWRHQIIERHGKEQFEPMITGWVAAARAIFAAGGNISLEQSGAIRCPVLLLNGDGEIGNPPRDFVRLAQRIANARYEFVADCGHAIQRDQPTLLLDRIHGFLHEVGVG